ncbi:CLUMA_CG015110, isoform A [Clunio marinus]|uniref:CLUMA_CG015110, isoform A n=1 Tax=Clunio marinus TaxID=568069 RepID=A0A1J1IQ12_9DIPT|nr:CLUMA_CG015110, isoform A [Clunio marinus]
MSHFCRIKAFVNIERKANSFCLTNTTPLFEKFVRKVKNEYIKFHKERDPSMMILEKALDSTNEKCYDETLMENKAFNDSFQQIRTDKELPFSIMQEVYCSKLNPSNVVSFPTQHLLKTCYFIKSNLSKEVFYKIQRQHKIWWMKYGASPGKYTISDLKNESHFKYVNIKFESEDLALDVERLKLLSLKNVSKENFVLNNFLFREANKKRDIIPDVIETTVDLHIASLALLLDAVNFSSEYIALHRRSAPYQLALIISEASNDLIDLARYIELLILNTEPEIDILNDAVKITVNKQSLNERLENFDQIGIPYSIILDKTSLDEGFLKLRNRNTTLNETIHLSDVTKYLINIFKSP